MLKNLKAGLLGYGILAVVVLVGILLTGVLVDQAPFRPDTGGLAPAWMIPLLLSSALGAFGGGWASRRAGENRRSVFVMIAILVGLAAIVVLVEAWIGPTASGRGFMEALFGSLPPDLPMGELLDGRPQVWFAVVNYLVAIVAAVTGARVAERRAPA